MPPPAASDASYRSALRTPGAAAFFLAAAPARVGVAMTGLGLVWLIHAETGSFGAAGLVTGAFAVAEALVGPQAARLMDRYGQTRVLVPLLAVHAGALTALVALVVTGAPALALTAAGFAAGAAIPQFGALSSARWSALLHGRAELAPAFALETFANEAAYLLGPALAVLAATRLHPAAGTVLAGVLVVGAGLAFAFLRRTAPEPATRPAPERTGGRDPRRPGDPRRLWHSPSQWGPRGLWGPRGPQDWRSLWGPRRLRDSPRLWSRSFVTLLVVNLALGVFFGSTQVSVSAFAADLHAAPAAGLMYGLMSAASLLAGLAYGKCARRTPLSAQLPLILTFLACASLLPLLARTPWQLGLALLLPGAGVAPCIVVASTLMASAVDRSVLTQAFTWANSASAAGVALSAAAVGRLVDGPGGPGAGFTVPFLALILTAAVARTSRRAFITDRPGEAGPRPAHPGPTT